MGRMVSATEQRERIQQTLIDLCVEGSYADVTLADLLRRAEIDEETFRRHFDDLEDCFCSFYLEMREQLMKCVMTAFASEEGWRNQIRAAAYALNDAIREDPRRARISFVEIWFVRDRVRAARDESMQALFGLIDLGRNENEQNTTSQFTAAAVGGAIYSRLQAQIARGNFDLEAEVPRLMYMVVLPYLGPDAAEEELSMPRLGGRPGAA